MGDPFKKVQPGDKLEIPAETFNAMIHAAVAHRQRMQIGPLLPRAPGQFRILVRNATGSDLGQFATVGLGDAVISPAENEQGFKQQVLFDAEVPVESKHVGRFGILSAPLPAGGLSDRIAIVGPTIARLKLNSTDHRYARPKWNDDILESALFGAAEIIWRQSDTLEEQWAIVLLGQGAVSELLWAEVNLTAFPPTNTLSAEDRDGTSLTLYLKTDDAGQGNRLFGVARQGSSGYADTQVHAVYNRLRGRWDVVAGNFVTILRGSLQEPIGEGQSGQVNVFWPEFGSDNMVQAGTVTAINYGFGNLTTGTPVTVAYDPVADRWIIIAA